MPRVFTVKEFQKHLGVTNEEFFALFELKPANISSWMNYLVIGDDVEGYAIYSKRRDVPVLPDRAG